MARRPPLSRALAELIDRLEPELRDAFLGAIDDLRNGVDFAALERALRANDVEAAIRALNIEAAAFSQYAAVRQSAFLQAGALEAAYIPVRDAASILFRFDMSNPRAEAWIRDQAATRIVGYTQEQVETARTVILDGYAKGSGPRQIATDIAGRIDRVTGRRTGGIIGLSETQAGYVQSMRARLLSGDPAEMRKVLSGQTLRDRRYDALIRRHIEAGTPLSQADVDKLTQRYADRLIARRAEDIARTETAQSVMGARDEAYAQALAKEGLPEEAVSKTWRHQGGEKNARVQHIAMHGVRVKGLRTSFIMPDGTAMQHSHDPAGGVAHNANCRCDTLYSVDFAWGLG